MKTRSIRRILAWAAALCLLAALLPGVSAADDLADTAVLTFSEAGIAETAPGSGYSVSGTTLTIQAAGVYRIKGSCSEGSVVISKGVSGVTLIFDNLSLASAATAPVVIKKSCAVILRLEGVSTLTDNEDPSTEETNADFEGAALKVKSGSRLTVLGGGTLQAVGSAKNGIKGAAESGLVVNGGSFVVTAANNGIGFDGSIEINAGDFQITAENDGIKAVPDETDTVSAGTVEIHGGSFTLRTQGDAIQAGSDLTITNGSFDIQTLDGYQSTAFNADTMSCKGLKASGSESETENATNQLIITGGRFLLNTADDAIHSDGDCSITGGSFELSAGDDGVHADSTLTLGSADGYERDPEITIHASYEGLEAGTLNAYAGKYYVTASDDGINAAGGSSNGSDPGGDDHFNPGRPGGPGGPGGGSTGDYSINISGGSFYVDCNGDGLDSNGALNLLGGSVTVFSMRANGDNSPLDADGSITIRGATVLAAGGRGMGVRIASGSQAVFTSGSSYSANTVLNVKVNGALAASETLPRNISYFLYSSPSLPNSGSCAVSAASSVTPCVGNAWHHAWDDGCVETPATAEASGVMKYTCTACGAVERQTIPAGTSEDDTGPGEETCEHEYISVVTAPTCTEGGYTTSTCSKCGQVMVTDLQDPLGHTFENGKCVRCGLEQSLPPLVREALEAAIEEAEKLDPGAYTDETAQALAEALEAAKKALDEAETQDEIDAAAKALTDAIAALEKKPTEPGLNKDGLEKAIESAEKINKDDYTEASVANLESALAEAKKALTDAKTQEEIDTAALALLTAINDLENKPQESELNVEELEEAVEAAEALNLADYTDESAQALAEALEAARKALAEAETQDEIDAAKRVLDEAVAALVEKTEANPKPTPTPTPTPTPGEHDCPGKIFTDMPAEGNWAHDPIDWAIVHKITAGKTATTFAPADGCTRAQVVTFLWRAAGEPAPKSTETPFTDLKADGYYVKAVAWAVENGITAGVTKDRFAPNNTCTRGQIVTFLHRYAGEPAPTTTDTPFTDVPASAFYAKAVAWAVENDVTAGISKDKFAPNNTCTRAQVVTFLYRVAK